MKTTAEKFWEKVEKTKTCWLWKAGTNRGYGRVTLPDGKGGYYHMYSHRWAYEAIKGPIPKGLTLDHLCRVTNCVNPDHLEAVTHRTNILRGIGPTAINARKTYCLRGHNFTPETTYISTKGGRHCNGCRCDKHKAKTEQAKFYKCGHPKLRNTFVKSQGLKCCLICHNKSWQKRRENRTHCQRGHDWSVPGNIFFRTDGRRQCAVCHKVASDRANAKKMAKARSNIT